MTSSEVNFDGLVGPTHNYAGLSFGNRASMSNAGDISNPREAALQGLEKMRLMRRLGLTQAVLPPHDRPDPVVLRQLGFGPNAEAIAQVAAVEPGLVASVMSASPMWAANAATVSPSADTRDGRVHFTPANLVSTTHRAFEARQATRILHTVFADEKHFSVHDPLPATPALADEGAANHSRLARTHGEPGVEIFVYGRGDQLRSPDERFPRRQTLAASRLIAHSHGLDPSRTRFVQQSGKAIDAGAFHNDVVSVCNGLVEFSHEDAFADPVAARRDLPPGTRSVVVPSATVPLDDAIASYLFNSQLVTLPDRTMALIAPIEVETTASTAEYLAMLTASDHPIDHVHIADLRQSMRNGGGPACLRLRVVLDEAERSALRGNVIADDQLIERLEGWVRRHYRDELRPDDLADPTFVTETRTALDELTQMLDLGALYDFQR